MGEYIKNVSPDEGEEKLIAAVQQIKKALESNKVLSDSARKILADLGAQLSSIGIAENHKDEELGQDKDEALREIEEQLNIVQTKIYYWEKEQAMIWDCGPEESNDYLKAVEETQRLIESLERLSISKDSEEDVLLRRAHDVLQTAMVTLEEEFKHLLVQNRQPFEPEHMSFRSNDEDDGSIISFGEESVDDVVHRDSMSRGSDEYIIELVHPNVIPDLKRIANLMFDLSYGRECSQAFISTRKDSLDDCLYILEVDKLSIEDVVKMEWRTLNARIRRWIRAMKLFVRVYLASEKFLVDQIFGDLESVGSFCFAESSRSSILQLLHFGEAITVGPHQPEKLIRILDMYEVLEELISDIYVLYLDDRGSGIKMECQEILNKLGDCAKATFLEFESAVASSTTSTPFPGGGIHHITRYVMNYIKALTEYNDTLNVLLRDHEKDGVVSSSPDTSPASDGDGCRENSPPSVVGQHFRSFISTLESNLEDKSKLYKDDALGHLFLMNNIHYMAEKEKISELRATLGDNFIRKHNGKFQQYAMNYERATWSSILSLLRDEGLTNPGSSSISKTLLKEQLQKFYIAFEDVYRSQTAWSVPDTQLREDLRISTSLKVIQAYRTFVGRHANNISDKYIKYNADDLENFLLDFFEGSPKSLHFSHRK
ncbi:hypothetical protein Leryth_012840 [Lithospermum erythrorhizon]|nr:hypothetical protein Leryth_012840 [Lithospermum erythrorhizon]